MHLVGDSASRKSWVRRNCQMVDQPVMDDWGDIVEIQRLRVCR